MWDFSGLTIGNYNGFIRQASEGKQRSLPKPDLVQSTHLSLWRELQPKPQTHGLALVPSFLGLYIWGLGQKSSIVASAEASFLGREWGNLGDTFQHPDVVFNTFPFLVFPSCLSLTPFSPQGPKNYQIPFFRTSSTARQSHLWTVPSDPLPLCLSAHNLLFNGHRFLVLQDEMFWKLVSQQCEYT